MVIKVGEERKEAILNSLLSPYNMMASALTKIRDSIARIIFLRFLMASITQFEEISGKSIL